MSAAQDYLDRILGKRVTKDSPIEERRFNNLGYSPPKVVSPTPRVATKPIVPIVTPTRAREQQPTFTTPTKPVATPFNDMILSKATAPQFITPSRNIEQDRLKRDIASTGRTEQEIIASGREIFNRPTVQATQEKIASLGRNVGTFRTPQDLAPKTGVQAGFERGVLKTILPESTFTKPQTGFLSESIEQKIEQQPKGAKAAEVAGQLAGTAIQYATVANVLKGIPAIAKLSQTGKFATTQGVDLLVDNVVQAPMEFVDAINNDKSVGEDAIAFGKRNLVDVGFNLLVGGAGEMFKKLMKSNDPTVKQAVQEAMDKMSAADRVKLLGDTPTVRTGLEFETPKEPVKSVFEQDFVPRVDEQVSKNKAFQDWRSKNFGGATGKVSEGDADALKQLYKEDTGIDIDLKQIETTKPLTQVEPLPQVTKPLQQAPQIPQVAKEVAPQVKPLEVPQPTKVVAEDIGIPKVEPLPSARVEVPQVTKTQPTTEGLTISTDGKKVSKFNETLINSDSTGEEVKQAIKNNPRLYESTTNAEQIETARAMIDANPEAMKNLVLTKNALNETPSDVELVAGKLLFEDLQNAGKHEESMLILEAIGEKYTKIGQALQTASLWSKSTPAGMQKWAAKTLNDAGVKPDEQLLKEVGQQMDVIKGMEDGYEKDLATAVLQRRVLEQIPPSLWQKVSTFQVLSHLLNAKTMGRNLLGNTAFAGAEGLSSIAALPFDAAMSIVTGAKTVKVGGVPRFLKNIEAGFDAAKKANREVNLDVDVTGAQKFAQFHGRTFKKGILGAAEKALAKGLKVPDEFFKGFRKADSLYQQNYWKLGKEANNMSLEDLVKKSSPKEMAQAEQEALYSTFQDNSLPAQMFQGTKDIMNKIGFGKTIKGGSGISTKEFGLGDLVIKYTRVPGNIISRGIEYSPVGYAKALLGMSQGKNQRELALELGRATTGTGMIGLSMYLASKGILVGEDKDGSYNKKALERSEGKGNYKVNINALNRLINGEDTELKPGDKLESYNWLQPVSTSLAVGAMLHSERKKQEPDYEKMLTGAIGEMVDIPSLMTINQMFYESQREDSNMATIASVPFTQAVSGFVPATVRQTAQFLDPVARETKPSKEAKGFERIKQTAVNKLKMATPILRETLEPRISPTGEVVEYAGGIVPSFIKPSIGTVYKPNKFTPKLDALSKKTDDQSFYPSRMAPSYVTVKKEKVYLTPKQRTEYQKTAGELAKDGFADILKDVNVDKLNDKQSEQLIKLLNRIKSKSREKAKQDLIDTLEKKRPSNVRRSTGAFTK